MNYNTPKKSTTQESLQDSDASALEARQWRENVAGLLSDAGRWSESINFRECGQLFGNFQILACADDPTHAPRALPFTCHLRYCPDCERRHQAELVAKYTPILKSIAEQDDRPRWSLKKVVLTTPFRLDSPSAPAEYQAAWEAIERWQQAMLQFLLKYELTDAEKRRQEVSYTAHGYGSIITAEFGGDTQHLHFHILAYMPYLDKFKSSELWREASGGECEITWISQVDYHAVDDAVREQVKYVTKFQVLPPRLVVKLADILDGSRRIRTYGTVRGAPAIEPEPHTCAICSAKVTIMRVGQYFGNCLARNIAPDAALLAAGERLYLDLKHGNKAREGGANLARSDMIDLPKQPGLTGFVVDQPIKKTVIYY